MQSNFSACLGLVLKAEGGYSNNPADPGRATNMGITQTTLASWRGHPVTVADVKALTADEAGKIYRARYWNAVNGDNLPAGIDYVCFDFAVNSGPARAAKALQQALGVAQDGVIGPVTVAAARKAEPVGVINVVTTLRMAYLRGLSTWPTFGNGWTSRVTAVRAAAITMAGQTPAVPYPPLPRPTPLPPKPAAPRGILAAVRAILDFIAAVLKGLRK